MLLALTIPAVAVVSLALILRSSLCVRERAGTPQFPEWDERMHEMDFGIFRALVDRNDWQYLHKSVSLPQFRLFRRKRIRLALRVLRRVERNTALLMEMGMLASLNGDAVHRRNADELVANTIRLRVNIVQARVYLYLQWLFPLRAMSLPDFASRCKHLWVSVGRLQQCI